MATGGFAVTISAVDGATSVIDHVNKKLASMQAPMRQLQAENAKLAKSIGRFSELTGVTAVSDTISRGFKGIGKGAAIATENVLKFAPALGAITAAASVAGVTAMATQFGVFGQRLLNTANRAGMATDSLHELENGARIAGVSAGTMTAAVTTLRDNLVDAVGGRAPAQFYSMMQNLGISFRNAAGGARNVTEVLPEVADKIARIKDPTLQARVATALFGGAAEDLLPFLRRGAAGMAEYNTMARRYGLVNNEGAEQAQKLRESQIGLQLSVEGLMNTIAQRVGPVLSPMLTQLAEWVAANREIIAADVVSVVVAIGDAIKSVNWTTVGKGIVTAADGVRDLVKELRSGNGSGDWMVTLFEKVAGFKLPEWLEKILVYKIDAPDFRSAPIVPGSTNDPASPSYVAPAPIVPGNNNFDMPGAGAGAPANRDMPSWWHRYAPRFLGGDPASVDQSVPAEGRTLLNAIARSESDGTYAAQVNPKSGAFGRYQFLESTWNETANRLGLTDRSPASQDKAAWDLAKRDYQKRTGGDLLGALQHGDVASVAAGLNRTWTSLPGGAEPNRATPGFAAAMTAPSNPVDVAMQHLGETPAQVNPFLKAGGAGLDATVNAWCAAFANTALKAAGETGTNSNVATSFLNWGQKVAADAVQKGDILVEARGHAAGEAGGHVGFATGASRYYAGQEQVEMVSGNEGGRVSRTWEPASAVEGRRALPPAAPLYAPPVYAPPVQAPAPTAATPAAPANGQATLTVRVPGSLQTSMQSSGDLWAAPPRVERGMPLEMAG